MIKISYLVFLLITGFSKANVSSDSLSISKEDIQLSKNKWYVSTDNLGSKSFSIGNKNLDLELMLGFDLDYQGLDDIVDGVNSRGVYTEFENIKYFYKFGLRKYLFSKKSSTWSGSFFADALIDGNLRLFNDRQSNPSDPNDEKSNVRKESSANYVFNIGYLAEFFVHNKISLNFSFGVGAEYISAYDKNQTVDYYNKQVVDIKDFMKEKGRWELGVIGTKWGVRCYF